MFFGLGNFVPWTFFLLWGSDGNRKGTSPVPLHTLGWVFDENFVDYGGIVKNFLGVSGREIFV